MSLPRTARLPYATATVILINVAVKLLAPNSAGVLGLNPSHFHPWTLITYTLCHASAGHLATNMALLAVFGSFAERRMRWQVWVAAYAGGAVAGALGELAMLAIQPTFDLGTIVGASAGVTALMGCAFTLAFRETQPDVWNYLVRIVAPGWVIVDGIRGVAAAGAPGEAQTAVWAHVVGFLFGVVLASLWRSDPRSVEEQARGLLAAGSAGEVVTLLQYATGPAQSELLADAWAALGDKEQAAKAQLRAVELLPSPQSIGRLHAYGGLGLLTPAKRMELSSSALSPGLTMALLETFFAEPPATPHRPAALLRLAELMHDPERARPILETIARDYPGSESADLATARLRSASRPG